MYVEQLSILSWTMSQTLINTVCKKIAISDLMLMAASYLIYIKKSQIKYWANPGFISRICQPCKTFLSSIWSVLWCILVELHLQDCQKTKCIFSTLSKFLIKQCLMEPKGNFSILFHLFFSPSRIFMKIAKKMTDILVVRRKDICNPHIIKWKIQVAFFTSRGTWRRDLFYYRVY